MEIGDIIRKMRQVNGIEKDFIPLHVPKFSSREKEYVLETIESTFVSSVGSYVNSVEDVLTQRLNVGRSVAVVNGTAALQMALIAAGVKSGDCVVTQSLTFVATANAISYLNAIPVFVDVDRDTMSLSSDSVHAFLEEYCEIRDEGAFNKNTGARIAAIMPMHTFGFMARMDELLALSSKWNIPIVEDAAESLGSHYKERPAGSMGEFGAISFNGNKVVTAGGGGIVTSNNKEKGDLIKHLTTTAKIPHPWEYEHDYIGYNLRMPNLNAALLAAQLERLDELIEAKTKLFEDYKTLLGTQIKFVDIPETTSKWNHWLISVETANRKERNQLLKATNEAGVMTRPIWKLLHTQEIYQHAYVDGQENASYLADRIVNIPSSAR